MILGLDIGTKRTGVAISEGMYARELTTVQTSADLLVDELAQICEAEQVDLIVAGLPLSEDGSYNDQTDFVESICEELEYKTGLSVELVDEYLTTSLARQSMAEMGIDSADIEKRIDQFCAAVILQQHIDERRKEEI